ncbi:histidine phosphatase family protein [Bacillus sp. AFS041924]|uniref:histidine phosphatase family protein n=1 Tax=Bacillus sp. AFS041924 TaxID=2033503 RepID=UPI000BFCE2A3|nr:histidine phosphatase family protein [Bacillus sp. AFS041924]PGS50163.1 histidine phosphatase family protein [Bacillus sp. AFS041924]
MEILLIRHGQSEADILNVHEGRADFSLTELGIKQVHKMAERVKDEFAPEIIWSSTLKRAKETATILSNRIGCEVKFEDDLMEHNNGVLAGLSFEDAKKIPMPKHPHERVENGESAIEFRMRMEMIFSRILANSTHIERIAIVAHGGVIHNLIHSFLKMPIHTDFGFFTGDTGIHLLEINNRGRFIRFLNDTNHIKSLVEVTK